MRTKKKLTEQKPFAKTCNFLNKQYVSDKSKVILEKNKIKMLRYG
jgi:hypothetical protein